MKYTQEDVNDIVKITKKYEATENGYPLMLFVTNFAMLFVCIHLLNIFKKQIILFR